MILKAIWEVMLKFAGIPFLIYGIPERLFSSYVGFLFFSSDHFILHNIFLLGLWIYVVYSIYVLFTKILIIQASKQYDIVDYKYDVELYNVPIVILYLIGVLWPVIVSWDIFYLPSWAGYIGIVFPLLVWVYYIFNTGVPAILIILRQIYVIALALLYVTMMIAPIAISVILLAFGISFWDSIDTSGLREVRTTTYYSDGSSETTTRYTKDENI